MHFRNLILLSTVIALSTGCTRVKEPTSVESEFKEVTKSTYIIVRLDILKDGAIVRTMQNSCEKDTSRCSLETINNNLETFYFPQDYKCNLKGALYQAKYRLGDVLVEGYSCKTSVYVSDKKPFEGD